MKNTLFMSFSQKIEVYEFVLGLTQTQKLDQKMRIPNFQTTLAIILVDIGS